MFPYFDDGKPGDEGYYTDCSPRRWRHWPVFSFTGGCIQFGYQQQMLMFKGKTCRKPSWVSGVEFAVVLDPRKWKLFYVDHTYYDGCHCMYQVGPFKFMNLRTWWCTKCMPDD